MKSTVKDKKKSFLKDVFLLSLMAIGGPGTHFTLFQKKLVQQKKYITSENFIEIYSFCQLLPGPTSTQTIIALARKIGGSKFSLLCLFIWVLPAFIFMTTFAILYKIFLVKDISLSGLKYIQPMACGFVFSGAWFIIKTFKKDYTKIAITLFAAVIASMQILGPYIFPILLLLSGLFYYLIHQQKSDKYRPKMRVKWKNITIYFSIFIASITVSGIIAELNGFERAKPWLIFENNYRFGSLVFGGGNVLIPLMFEQFVSFRKFIGSQDFLVGVGLLQAIPGPVFSLSSYTGALIMHEKGILGMIGGSAIATIAIFAPGYIMVQFIYPIWHQIKNHPVIHKILAGVIAAAGGLIISSGYILSKNIHLDFLNVVILIFTFILTAFTKIPSPIIVIGIILVGIFS